jgi:hypothetical protein
MIEDIPGHDDQDSLRWEWLIRLDQKCDHPDNPIQKGRAMVVSFASDILPLFRAVDIRHMAQHDVLLDDYGYMSDPGGDATFPDHANARNVFANVSPTPNPPNPPDPPEMPPGGPYWTDEQLQLYNQWMSDGFQA